MEGADELVDIGGGRRYMSDRPSRRFPIYTRGNAGEVYPEPYYPLSWSLTAADGGAVFESASRQSGILGAEDFAEDAAVSSGVFAGYAYLNLSLSRVGAIRMPGAGLDDVDRAMLGGADLPPHVARKGDKNLFASLRGLRAAWRTIGTDDLPELRAQQAKVKSWMSTLPDPDSASDEELRVALQSSNDLIFELFETHLVVSGQSAIAQGALAGMCRDHLDDENLVLVLTSGLGDVASAAPSNELWDLGRLVADSADLTLAFDGGVDEGLLDRIESTGGDDAAAFTLAFSAFLDRHGCRGPNEWETACPTWGTQPTLALALADRMRGAAADHDPRVQNERLRGARVAATEAALGRLKRRHRWLFRRVLRSAHVLSTGRERSKTTVIEAIHGLRVRSMALGRRVAERGGGEPDDLWFVLSDELEDYLDEPASFTEAIAERRATRELLATLEPPFVFDGAIPPIDQWTRRADAVHQTLAVGEALTGIAGCAGIARGRACVVIDPADPGDLGPGDVLIAPSTDPAWTPLFVPVEAVVVDVGAQMSHAVIVSRELGLPCVVSATDATRRIPHGALIEVDGDRGEVRMIQSAPDPIRGSRQ
ncbi:MAG: PEP-utilizing enzyme [Acidimicrobiia bacterium]|nr:PEP-utilizing enzyme [Acidimicrobiia bacterium]